MPIFRGLSSVEESLSEADQFRPIQLVKLPVFLRFDATVRCNGSAERQTTIDC